MIVTAYECDRCGELFKREYRAETRIARKKPVINGGWYYLDLCPRCQEELENWIGGSSVDSNFNPTLRNGA